MKLLKKLKVEYETPKSIYCLNVPQNHEFVVRIGNEDIVSHNSINFLFIYGGSSWGLSPNIYDAWSDEEMKDYIVQNNLEVKTNKDGSENLAWTVADDIRNKFFETYPMLMPFIESTIKLVMKQGYADSMQGGRRHIPRLLYVGKDTDKSELANLKSIAINAPVLIFEAIYMFTRMRRLRDEIKMKNLKSKLVYMIHDSVGGFVNKDEGVILQKILKSVMEDTTSFEIPFLSELQYGDTFGYGDEVKNEEDALKIYDKYFSKNDITDNNVYVN